MFYIRNLLKKIKKGAMFGLDARIALAIFGALSVISGASLYSAIQVSNMEKWRQYFENISKASEHYYLDNGVPIPNSYGLFGEGRLGNLVENYDNMPTWKGAYITNVFSSSSYGIKDAMTLKIGPLAMIGLTLHKKSTWTNNSSLQYDVCVLNAYDCNEWIYLSTTSASDESKIFDLFKGLDEYIDSGDGELDGKVRYNHLNSGYLMYQGITHYLKQEIK